MAQSGFTPISLYYTSTALAVPVNTNLVSGELALNITDEKLYFKNAAGVVKLIGANLMPVANGGTGVTNSTGSGSVVLNTSPTLVTPALGTPSALVGTNITGTATNFTASNVTTNANLTGAVTSSGNATSLGSFTSLQLLTALTDETGTGANVFATSPTLVTPILGTPQSGVVTNLTGTASININGTVGATTPSTGAFTTLLLGTTTSAGKLTIASTTNPALALPNIAEVATVSATAATGMITYDLTTQSVLYYTSNATANWALNVRGNSGLTLNAMMAVGQSMTLAFLNTNGATAYYASGFYIDGSPQYVRWQNGIAPTGGSTNANDVYTYTIIKTGSATYTVLASQTKFA